MSKNYKRRLNPVWHRMLYSSYTHTATVGVKGLTLQRSKRSTYTDDQSGDHGPLLQLLQHCSWPRSVYTKQF